MDKIQKVIEQFKLNVLSMEQVPESYSSTVYKLQLANKENVYIKIPFTRDKLYREYKLLMTLQGALPVPSVLNFWEGNESITGALLLEEIKGVPCLGKVDKELAFQIGKYHAKLHAISMHKFGTETENGFQQPLQNEWRPFVQKQFESYAMHAKEVLPSDLFEKSMRHFEISFSSLPTPDGPCIIHMDFRPGNILVQNNNVVGIIDFESARAGSTEIDFTKINRDIWSKYPDTREAYIAGYETVRPIIDLDKVLPFYSFYDAFCSVGWCKNRGIEQHQDFLNENVERLRSIL